jgi:hypothetical protein
MPTTVVLVVLAVVVLVVGRHPLQTVVLELADKEIVAVTVTVLLVVGLMVVVAAVVVRLVELLIPQMRETVVTV